MHWLLVTVGIDLSHLSHFREVVLPGHNSFNGISSINACYIHSVTGVSRMRPIDRPSPISTRVLPPGVYDPQNVPTKRTPSSSSDNPLIHRPPPMDNSHARPYASFNDGWNKQRPMVSMETRQFGQRYGPQNHYQGNQMSYSMSPRQLLNSIHDDSSEMSLEASQVWIMNPRSSRTLLQHTLPSALLHQMHLKAL